MKIVREYIEFKNMDFKREKAPKEKMDIGERHRIESWLIEQGFEEDKYRINQDFSIDSFDDVNLIGKGLRNLPDFINFDTIFGGFYAGGNPWQTLDGFPKEIKGDLQLNSPASPSPAMKKFDEDEIRKIIKVNGEIYHR